MVSDFFIIIFFVCNLLGFIKLICRKDSFITHRAFCDALTEESARITSVGAASTNLNFRSDHNTVSINPHHGFSNSQPGLQDVTGIPQFGGFRPEFASAGN